jgi:primary-amine oxidase
MLKKVQLKKAHQILLVVVVIASVGILLTVLDGQHLASAANSHPMDPLTTEELSAVTRTLAEENLVGSTDLYSLITLEEPPKEDVLKWKPGDPVSRLAFAIVKKGPETFEAIVDTIGGKVLSWKQVEDVQTGLLPTVEWNLVQTIVRGNQEWQAAARKRGIENFREVICVPNTVGYFAIAEEEGHRLVKVVCYSSSGSNNYWGRPIEGLIAVVDLNTRELVKLIDTGVVPVPTAPADFDENSVGSLREPPNPISIEQSEGPSFKVTGHMVEWQKWQFHFRMDPRVGAVVSLVRYDDNGNLRSILYEGSLSEMFIPYMDPDVGWYFRTFMDAGEEGMGRMAVALQPGLDCPANAVFFDATFADDHGKPYTQANAACLFERYAGDIAWRHFDSVTGQNEVRKQTDLVLRSISSVGNYDYIFDWIFRQDGSIKIALGATGIPLVKAVGSRTLAEDQSGLDTAYGHQIAENTVAINHDHFISYRLDLDVDGQQNSFVYEPLTPERLDGESPRKSIWVLDSRTAATEEDAKLQLNIQQPALWRVINSNVIGPLGYPVSYQLVPQANAVSLLGSDDFPQQRAGFTDFNLWVTPYNPQERYAAGTYPNQSKGGDGLPAWTSANRPIQNTDLVLWYTLGFHHVVRAEDWPVLPTTWSEFEIRPFDFFQRNPALDIPASEDK